MGINPTVYHVSTGQKHLCGLVFLLNVSLVSNGQDIYELQLRPQEETSPILSGAMELDPTAFGDDGGEG